MTSRLLTRAEAMSSLGPRWYLLPAGIAIVSRLYSAVVLIALHFLPGIRQDLLLAWDAAWYVRIAETGYHGGVVHGGHDFPSSPPGHSS